MTPGVILKGIFLDFIQSCLVDKMRETGKDFLNSKGDTLESQFRYCIDKSLMYLGKKYKFEYDLKIRNNLYDKLLNSQNVFSYAILKEIVSESLDLPLENEFYGEWVNVIRKIIATDKLTILRDFIGLDLKQDEAKKDQIVYPRLLTAKPALPPEQYVDRTEEQAIIDKLEINKKLVLVNGIGGIGKSTVCRKIFHRLNDEQDCVLAWVVYNGKDLLQDIKNQIYYPQGGKKWKANFVKFIEQDIDEDAVIFIDNLDITEDDDEFLQRLSNAKCNVVCTSRIEKFSHFEVVPIKYLSEEQCIEIFINYYGQVNCDLETVRDIIARAGRHTLVIEILAKIGKAEHYSVQELKSKLEKEGFDLDGIVSVKNKEDTLVGHLSRTFNFDDLSSTQKKILICIAILPNQWVPYRFKEWIGLENNYNINYLVTHAWIVNGELGYYMHPVIKEVVKRGIPFSENTIMKLIAGISEELGYRDCMNVEKAREMIPFAESAMGVVKTDNEVISKTSYNISVLYGQLGEYDLANKYIKRCIQIEENQKNSMDLLASAYNHQGYIFYYQYYDSKAESAYKQAYDLRKQIGKIQQIAETASNLALLYQGMWKSDQMHNNNYLTLALKYQRDATKRFEQIFKGKYHPKLASAYNNMAVIYYSTNDYETAIYYYRKCERIRLQLKNKISLGDLSVTYKGLGECYIAMATEKAEHRNMHVCYKIALLCIENGIKIRKEEIYNGNLKLNIEQLYQMKQLVLDALNDIKV